MCGMSTGNLTNYIGRGNVFVDENDLVESTHKVNAIFLQHHLQKMAKKHAKQQVKELENSTSSSSDNNQNQDQQSSRGKKGNYGPELVRKIDLENEIKEATLKKHNQEIQLLQSKNDKINGVVIPTELVKIIFRQHTKSMMSEFQNATDKILRAFSKKRDMSSQEQAEMRSTLIEAINIGMKNSVEVSKKNIQNIINEYSETRGVGEKK